jgi:hypothetical protein
VWRALGAGIDFFHALLMTAWVLGLPLLFSRRVPRSTRVYSVYAIAFIGVSQLSRALLGECFLTTLARACWDRAPLSSDSQSISGEWFTVRIAQAVFRMTPTHRSIAVISEALIFLTAAGMLISLRRHRTSTVRASARSRGGCSPARWDADSPGRGEQSRNEDGHTRDVPRWGP